MGVNVAETSLVFSVVNLLALLSCRLVDPWTRNSFPAIHPLLAAGTDNLREPSHSRCAVAPAVEGRTRDHAMHASLVEQVASAELSTREIGGPARSLTQVSWVQREPSAIRGTRSLAGTGDNST